MTEESSTISHLSVAMTEKRIETSQTTDVKGVASSSYIGDKLYWEWSVIFIAVVGLAGNGLILYALVVSKQHKKHMLIVNQNVLDLFSSIFLIITFAVQVCRFDLTGAVGYWVCIVILSENLVRWATNGSMVNLALITVDRYLLVVYPMRSKKWLRPWVIYSAMAFSWIVSIVYNSILVIYSSTVIDGVCHAYATFDSFAANMISVIVYVLFFYLIILAIFIYCYGRILATIRRQASVMASHNTSGSSTAQTQSPSVARQALWPATVPLDQAPLRPSHRRFKRTSSRR